MAEPNSENHRISRSSCLTDQQTENQSNVSSTDCDGGDAAGDDYVEGGPVSSVEKSDSTQSSSTPTDDLDDAFGSIDEDEEPLSGSELSDLRKEGDMPLEELLAVYGCPRLHDSCGVTSASLSSHNISTSSAAGSANSSIGGVSTTGASSAGVSSTGVSSTGELNETYSSSEEEILSNQDLTLDKDEIARDLLMRSDTALDHETSVHDLITIIDLKTPVVEPSKQCFAASSSQSPDNPVVVNSSSVSSSTGADHVMGQTSFTSSTSVYDHVTSSLRLDDDDDDSDDSDYQPEDSEDSWKKTVSVGAEFQATIPECIPFNKTATAYTVDERLLWDPSKLSSELVDSYCRSVNQLVSQCAVMSAASDSKPSVNNPTDKSPHVRDDEQALYMLLQCNYNVDEALRRRQMEVIPPSDPLSLWSNEEQTNFTHGLRQYGKDFYAIQQNKVRSRSVSELVQFYYLWKKTDQYSIYISGHNGRDRGRAASSSSSNSGDDPTDVTDNPSRSMPACDGAVSMPHMDCSHGPDVDGDIVPSCYPSWQELTHQHCPVDGLDFLSAAPPDFSAVNLAEAYHEPYTDPGMVPDGSYYRHHHAVGGGDSPYCADVGGVALRGVDPCRLVCSPYHDSYGGVADQGLPPYSYPNPADNCHVPYYHSHPHHYANDVLAYADPVAFASPSHSSVFYPPMPIITGGNGDEHVDFSGSTRSLHVQYQSPHHLASIIDEYVGLEPSAKRFKPSVGLLDHGIVKNGLMGVMGGSDSRLHCAVDACADDSCTERLTGHLRAHHGTENKDFYNNACAVEQGCINNVSPEYGSVNAVAYSCSNGVSPESGTLNTIGQSCVNNVLPEYGTLNTIALSYSNNVSSDCGALSTIGPSCMNNVSNEYGTINPIGQGCANNVLPEFETVVDNSSLAAETSENSSSSSSADSVVSAAVQHDISESMSGVRRDDQSLQNNSSIAGYSSFNVSTLQNMSTKMLAQ